MRLFFKTIIVTYSMGVFTSTAYAQLTSSDFQAPAEKREINPVILEGICRYESDNGRVKYHHNKNGTWDVGYCQNHRSKKTKKRPRIPKDHESVTEAAEELKYWRKQHNRFCVRMYNKSQRCGQVIYGKWRGIKNCHLRHPWWAHYNWGFRVLRNGYARGAQCFINNGFKRCGKKKKKQITF